MANQGTRTFSDTFWMISGTSKNWSKSGPVDLLTITKMAQRIQETLWEHPAKILFMSILDSKNQNLSKNVCPRYNISLICFRVFLKNCVHVSKY